MEIETEPVLIKDTIDEKGNIGEQRSVSTGTIKRTGLGMLLFASAGVLLLVGSVQKRSWRSDSKAKAYSSGDELNLDEEKPDFQSLWQNATHTALKSSQDMQNSINGIKASAQQAKRQIDDWATKGMAATEGVIAAHIQKLTHAVVHLVDIETDFKLWCQTQWTLFHILDLMLQKKFDDADDKNKVDLTKEVSLLEHSLAKGQDDIRKMQAKVQTSQCEFTELVASSKMLKRQIKEEKEKTQSGVVGKVFTSKLLGGAVKWAAPELAKFYNKFDDQLETVEDMTGQLAQMDEKAHDDYKKMGKVKSQLASVETFNIPDPQTFRTITLPLLQELVDLLGKYKDEPLNFDKIFGGDSDSPQEDSPLEDDDSSMGIKPGSKGVIMVTMAVNFLVTKLG